MSLLFGIPSALLLAGLLVTGIIAADGLRDNLKPCDAAVVLGARVYDSGRPSPSLRTRLDRAAELYQKRYFPLVIVSGGDQGNGYHQTRVMSDYLTARGVPQEAQVLDLKGVNTFHTAANTARILEKNRADSVMVITQFFHITRSRYALRRFGVNTIASARGRQLTSRDWYGLIRDTVALGAYLFKDYSLPAKE